MSEVDQIDNVMTLEDLFLSAEFGQTMVDSPPPVVDPLFLETSLGAPLLPLAAFPSATGAHGTTTHMRRNRAFATASGVAAALLIAVGFISNTGKPGTAPGLHSIGPSTTTPTTAPSGVNTQPKGNVGGTSGTPGTPGAGGGSNILLSSATVGGPGTGSAAVLAGDQAGTATPVTKPTTTSKPAPATAPSGSVLSPVVSLVGHVVVTTGNTVSGVGGTLTTALPPLSPVTGIVSGLGGTLSLLGNNLIAAA